MKIVILAGGFGTRISEESYLRPKPMVTIGEQPILWHIMKIYSHYGYNDFIICCGYKGYMIKEYFSDYYLYRSNVTFDFRENNKMIVHENVSEPWQVTLIDTGLNAQTGARIKRLQKYIGNERFGITYGDGVSNVDLPKLYEQHQKTNKVLTVTGVQPGGRFGVIDVANDGYTVGGFREKAKGDGGWINGGFMIAEPQLFDYLSLDDTCVLEQKPMEWLAAEGRLGVYKHTGFWQCMDTKRDHDKLEWLWKHNMAAWKVWA